MNTRVFNRKCPVLFSVLLVVGAQGIGYGQLPQLVASTGSPMKEKTLDGGKLAMPPSDGAYSRYTSGIGDAVILTEYAAGIIVRNSKDWAVDTVVTAELHFNGQLDNNAAPAFSAGTDAVANDRGTALPAEMPVTAGLAPYARDPAKDINTLDAAGNETPVGIWSDGATMWVVDDGDKKLYAYDMGSRTRDAGKDFNSPGSAGNDRPSGIWSDGTTMWVVDRKDNKLYAYDMASQARDTGKDFDSLGPEGNGWPEGIWSDGATMWVADRSDNKLYAYFMPSNGGATAVVPSVSSLAPGDRALTVSWAAPSNDGGSSITAYDLRYIRSDAPDKADANWTVVEDAWTTGSGPLSHELTGLSGGTQYDVQIRSISDSGDGPWSAVDTATPAVQGPVSTDFNGDGKTDFVDFFLFADAYGGTDARFDLDGNGTVDFADFFRFVDAFGS